MPDASVVEQTFVNAIAGILYTSAYQDYAVVTSDVIGQQFRAYRGWPVDNVLVDDLMAGITNISVFSMPGARNTTRFLRKMMIQPVKVPSPTMLASLEGNQIAFTGITSTSELIGVSVGSAAGMSIRLAANDTPTTVAQKFAAGLPNATASNGVLTVNDPRPLGVVLGMDITYLQEVHRQCGLWKISIWAPTPQLRDLFSATIDPNLQALDRFFFADGSCSGPVINCGGTVDDVPEKQHLWRRDLHYETEYPTDVALIVPVMTLGEVTSGQFTAFTTGVTPQGDFLDLTGIGATADIGAVTNA